MRTLPLKITSHRSYPHPSCFLPLPFGSTLRGEPFCASHCLLSLCQAVTPQRPLPCRTVSKAHTRLRKNGHLSPRVLSVTLNIPGLNPSPPVWPVLPVCPVKEKAAGLLNRQCWDRASMCSCRSPLSFRAEWWLTRIPYSPAVHHCCIHSIEKANTGTSQSFSLVSFSLSDSFTAVVHFGDASL